LAGGIFLTRKQITDLSILQDYKTVVVVGYGDTTTVVFLAAILYYNISMATCSNPVGFEVVFVRKHKVRDSRIIFQEDEAPYGNVLDQ
jgi:hypothetical protein